MVEYSKEERRLIDDCLAFYRAKTFPDYTLNRNDKDTILEAIEYAHKRGQVIAATDKRAHAFMRSIQRKCGLEVEEPEERQKRLALERYEKRHNILIEAKKEEAKAKSNEAKAKEAEVEKLEVELEAVKAKDKGVADAVVEAQKKALEAQQKSDAEILRLKNMLKKEQQKVKDLASTKEVIKELAKEEEAKVIENTASSDGKSLEEKSIAELVDELTKPE